MKHASKHEETRLWIQMKSGDRGAFSHLFQRYYQTLYDYGINFCQREALVKDTAQDVFAYIWEKKDSLSNVASVRAYLIASMRRMLIRELNKLRKIEEKQQFFSADLENIAFIIEAPETALLDKQDKLRFIREKLTEIPERMREALFLKVYNGLRYKEISEIMDISPQVARNYVSQALQRLSNFAAKTYQPDFLE